MFKVKSYDGKVRIVYGIKEHKGETVFLFWAPDTHWYWSRAVYYEPYVKE